MMIGHIPASYIISRCLERRLAARVKRRPIALAGVAGAIAPDLDLLYFYLIDNRQHHHHTYWPHFPLVWTGMFVICLVWYRFGRQKPQAVLAIVFAANGLVHMMLDTVAGEIAWFAPFMDQRYVLFTIPARYHPWQLNFILHESFALELALVVCAVVLWRWKWA